ncbi:MAG: hypothetical protein ACE10O_00385, partial [Candidatus Acidiferrales bacterium]
MFGNRIKLDDELFQKVKQCAEAAGYSFLDSSRPSDFFNQSMVCRFAPATHPFPRRAGITPS